MRNKYRLHVKLPVKLWRFFLRVIFVFVLFSQPFLLRSQSDAAHETENRLKKAATKYFEDGDYLEAYPLYSQLLSLYPKEPNYNYRFGACILFTKADKTKAMDYLRFSVRYETVDALAYYYLARGFHLNYKFNAAIQAYKKFEQLASSSELKKYPVTRLIEMCESGKNLLASTRDLDVLRKKELGVMVYFRTYDMHENGGALIAEPIDFKSKLDKEKIPFNLMYLTPDKSKAFFSSYGNNEANGKDIYMVERKPDGTWGSPENLGNAVNTPFDEDYPVYDAPRNTLYFCSKGHNSMGGYDIFRSIYYDSAKTWSEPENLDFPINTPDDDILLVPDSLGQTAFFASGRASPQGRIAVYKIALHLHPLESIIVGGKTYSDKGITPTSCKITVKDAVTDSTIGVYTSSEDGSYSFDLPKGRNYNFTIESTTHKTQSQSVTLPAEQSGGMVKQDITFDPSGNLQIQNYTAETSNDSDNQVAVTHLQEQAQMNINVDTNSIKNLLAQNKSVPTNNNATNSSTDSQKRLSVSETKLNAPDTPATNNNTQTETNTGSSDITQLKTDAQGLDDNATKAIDYARNKMEEAQQLQAQAENILNNQHNNAAKSRIPDSIAYAKSLINQSKELEEKGLEAYQLAAEYKDEAASKNLEIQKNEKTNSSGNEISTDRVSPGDLIRRQAQQVKEDSFQVVQNNEELAQETNRLEQQTQDFVTQAGQTTDAQQKVALLQQADDLTKSKQEKKQEIEKNNAELIQLHAEYTWLSTKAKKEDSAFIAQRNKGDNTNKVDVAIQSKLQQDIDTYALAIADTSKNTTSDPSGNEIVAGADTLHHYQKNFHFTSQPDNTSVTNTEAPNTSQQIATTNNSATEASKNASNDPFPRNTTNEASSTDQVQNPNGDNSGTETNNQKLVANNNSTAISDNGNSRPDSSNSSFSNVPDARNNNTVVSTNSGESQINSGKNQTANSNQQDNTSAGNIQKEVGNNLSGTTNTNRSEAFTTPASLQSSREEHKSTIYPNTLLDSLANVAVASKSSGVSTGNSGHPGNNTVSNVEYTDTVAVNLNQKAQNYFTAGSSLTNAAKEMRSKAGSESDRNKSEQLYRQADSLDELSSQLNLRGDENTTEAVNEQYQANSSRIKNIKKNKSRDKKIVLAKKMMQDADNNYQQYLSEKDKADNEQNLSTKQVYIESAKENIAKAVSIQQQAEHLYFQADSEKNGRSKNISYVDNNSSNNFNSASDNSTVSVPLSTDISSSTEKKTAEVPVNTTTGNTTNNADNKIVAVNATPGSPAIADPSPEPSIFKEIHKSFYSESNPIPIDPVLPKGLILAVQIGAFRNPIAQNAFKGFEPIMGLTSKQGYIRYAAGLFKTLDPAKDALRKIHALGYSDAFIIAFYDGKRITIQEAYAKLGISAPIVATQTPQSVQNTLPGQPVNPTAVAVNNTQGREINTTPDNTNTLENNEPVTVAKHTITPSEKTIIGEEGRRIKDTVAPVAKSLKKVKGLVYTVQVGAFSKHKNFTKLSKLKHLYSLTDDNGIVRYNCGIYKDIADARAARDIIVAQTPIKDAFVAVYYNGSRIGLAKAAGLVHKNIETPSSAPTSLPPSNPVPPPIQDTAVEEGPFASASMMHVIFTVRIASFSGTLQVDTVNKILQYASEGIEPQKDNRGYTTYYAGKFTNYETAHALQQKLLNEGFQQAFIVAYYKGRRISVQEARLINGQ